MLRELYIDSWKKLTSILFIPDLLTMTIGFITAFSFIFFSDVSTLFNDPRILSESIVSNYLGVKSFLLANLLELIIFFIIFLITNFIIGTGISASKYAMFRDTVLNKRLTLLGILKSGKDYFWKVLYVRLIIFLISICILLFGLIFFLVINLYLEIGTAILVTTGLMLLLLVSAKLLFIYRYPALLFGNRTSFKAVRRSARLFFKNPYYFMMILLIITLTGIFINLISSVFSNLISLLNFLPGLYIITLQIFIGIIFNLILAVWGTMFIFLSYKRLAK